MKFSDTHPMYAIRRLAWLVAFLAVVATVSCGGGSSTKAQPAAGLEKINHVIVIYQENWSFDGLYGNFPGANGLANAGAAVNQVDKAGNPLTALPQPIDTNQRPAVPDPRFPANMPVAPYEIGRASCRERG